ncbi:hypothetical protein BJ166DRAFT_500451 [Pestalotiopsis sp. NC0098]|nr:hypothetical protein BJ166DRAFT_500451 [Pestalotiopsis sp. NC0098]
MCQLGPINALNCPLDRKCLKTTTTSKQPGIPTLSTPLVAARSIPSDTIRDISRDILLGYKLQCKSQTCSSSRICSDKGVLQYSEALPLNRRTWRYYKKVSKKKVFQTQVTSSQTSNGREAIGKRLAKRLRE